MNAHTRAFGGEGRAEGTRAHALACVAEYNLLQHPRVGVERVVVDAGEVGEEARGDVSAAHSAHDEVDYLAGELVGRSVGRSVGRLIDDAATQAHDIRTPCRVHVH